MKYKILYFNGRNIFSYSKIHNKMDNEIPYTIKCAAMKNDLFAISHMHTLKFYQYGVPIVSSPYCSTITFVSFTIKEIESQCSLF